MNTTRPPRLSVHIRWMIRRDMPEVFEIERAALENPWSEDDFLRCLRQRNCIGMVAEHDGRLVGFMIYELHKDRLHILNFCVHPDCRRRGVGSQMVGKLVSKLSAQRRDRILVDVRERNLDAQLFFAAAGFRAVGVLREFYDDWYEDGYRFELRFLPGRDARGFQDQVGRATERAAG